MAAERRLLTIGHSYVVASNRRLAHEMALQGGGRWQVTAVAPARFRGDMRSITLEPLSNEAAELRPAIIRFDRSPHLMWYDAPARMMTGDWDLVHCWEEPYVLAAAQVARRTPASTAFVVSTFQNIDKRYPWPLNTFERNVIARADGWIAFGESAREVLQKKANYSRKLSRVISPGVDATEFAPDPGAGRRVRGTLGWEDEALVVGYVGRFVSQKGLATLTAALAASNSPWRALFVGGGPLEGDLKAFSRRHPGRVHVETGVPHAGVPQWLNAMSALCAPSETTPRWREQFGRMLIEAMACGVPVIASNSGEIPHVVGDAGVLVNEGVVRSWTTAIDRVLGDNELRQDLSERGRQRVQSRFAWPVVARQHLEFFETVLESRSGS